MSAKDTSAWYVMEQILNHVFGSDDMSDEEINAVCRLFWKSGGLWKDLIDGDIRHIGILEECIGDVINARRLDGAAEER